LFYAFAIVDTDKIRALEIVVIVSLDTIGMILSNGESGSGDALATLDDIFHHDRMLRHCEDKKIRF